MKICVRYQLWVGLPAFESSYADVQNARGLLVWLNNKHIQCNTSQAGGAFAKTIAGNYIEGFVGFFLEGGESNRAVATPRSADRGDWAHLQLE